ncbi:hypothetical protein T439DRAFT_329336 [Meredithblackwellia eburnea MCA 4105]
MSDRPNLMRTRTNASSYETKLSKALFVALRVGGVGVQQAMWSRGWAAKALYTVGLRTGEGLLFNPSPGTVPGTLVALSAVSAFRHIYWSTMTNPFAQPFSLSIMVATYNCLMDSIGAIIALRTADQVGLSSLLVLGWKQYFGIALFGIGIGLEFVLEEQRKSFKKKGENVGKVHDDGLAGVVRHANYLGYTLWRTGIALATGSVGFAIFSGAMQTLTFWKASIPELDGYMSQRYADKWEAYKRKVPYSLFPGII